MFVDINMGLTRRLHSRQTLILPGERPAALEFIGHGRVFITSAILDTVSNEAESDVSDRLVGLKFSTLREQTYINVDCQII